MPQPTPKHNKDSRQKLECNKGSQQLSPNSELGQTVASMLTGKEKTVAGLCAEENNLTAYKNSP